MTLLVINIELPEGFHPKTNQEMHGLSGLSDTSLSHAYAEIGDKARSMSAMGQNQT